MTDILLLFPPVASPMHPPQSIAALRGALVGQGVSEVVTLDLNVEGWTGLYANRDGMLSELLSRRDALVRHMARKRFMTPRERRRLELLELGAEVTVSAVREAAELMRSPEAFASGIIYQAARNTLEMTNALLSAVLSPLVLTFHEMSIPGTLSIPPSLNPFRSVWQRHIVSVLEMNPRIVGVSVVYKGQLAAGLTLCRMLRSEGFCGVLVLGGSVVARGMTYMGENFRSEVRSSCDYVVLGEGESAIVQMVTHTSMRQPPIFPNTIECQWGKEGPFERSRTLEDMRHLPIPDYGDTSWSYYLSPQKVLYYDGARGCYWGRCSFCSYGLAEPGEACVPYRDRGAERIAEHLRRLAEKYACQHFVLADDCMAPKVLLEVSDLLSQGSRLRLTTEVRAERIFGQASAARRLYRGGIEQIFIGVESASQRVLDLMEKGIRSPDLGRIYEACWNEGIAIGIQTFAGFPGERYGEMLLTLKHIAAFKSRLTLAAHWDFCLLVGSQVWSDPARFAVELENPDQLYYDEVPFRDQRECLTDQQKQCLLRWRQLVTVGDKDPWAGSAMSAHTALLFAAKGRDELREWKRSDAHAADLRFRTVSSHWPLCGDSRPSGIVYRRSTRSKATPEAAFSRFPGHW